MPSFPELYEPIFSKMIFLDINRENFILKYFRNLLLDK